MQMHSERGSLSEALVFWCLNTARMARSEHSTLHTALTAASKLLRPGGDKGRGAEHSSAAASPPVVRLHTAGCAAEALQAQKYFWMFCVFPQLALQQPRESSRALGRNQPPQCCTTGTALHTDTAAGSGAARVCHAQPSSAASSCLEPVLQHQAQSGHP